MALLNNLWLAYITYPIVMGRHQLFPGCIVSPDVGKHALDWDSPSLCCQTACCHDHHASWPQAFNMIALDRLAPQLQVLGLSNLVLWWRSVQERCSPST